VFNLILAALNQLKFAKLATALVHRLATAPVPHGVFAEISPVATLDSIFKMEPASRTFVVQTFSKAAHPVTARVRKRATAPAPPGVHAGISRVVTQVTISKTERAKQMLASRMLNKAAHRVTALARKPAIAPALP
jgi:hypothetical protein